jgi:colanic acid/amylovoran biosynthesis glycosyltransferase
MKPLKILYICTTFPKLSEQFIQREVDGLRKESVDLEIVSMWGGERLYKGVIIRTFPKWKLLKLVWTLPWAIFKKPGVLVSSTAKFFSGKPPSPVNFFETLLGYGFALAHWLRMKQDPPDLIHGIWATSPVSAAQMLSALTGIPFSMGAHAFDVFEDGGDWHLKEKLDKAKMVHSSSMSTQRQLLRLGADKEKLRLVRRGLTDYPNLKPIRKNRRPIRLISVGRLVEKKGFFYQIDILKALKKKGIPFQARIVGSGELDGSLRDYRDKSGLHNELEFWGKLTFDAVQEQLVWADLFLFTGQVSSKGDRDGLPNVIGEAMAHGVAVLTTDVGATTEAVEHRCTGMILSGENTIDWVEAIENMVTDDLLISKLRKNGRIWVEEHFDAHKNAHKLFEAFQFAVSNRS